MGKRRDSTHLDMCAKIQREFGSRFSSARKQANMLQKNVAERMGLSRTTISNIERGVQRIYLDQVFEAAALFGVDLEALLPRVQDIFGEAPPLRTATDDPLSQAASQDAQRVVREVRAQPVMSGLSRARTPGR